MPVSPGIDVLLEQQIELVAGRPAGLVSNAAAVNGNMTTTVEALRQAEKVHLAALFGPEHGFYGRAEAGERVESAPESPLGLPIYSLYGESRRPTSAMLAGLELLIFDVQCVGVRFYTYTTTLLYVLQAAAEHDIPVIVCDRPNPIDGTIIEGPLLKPEFESFTGCGPMPIRHGLTMGELARLFSEFWGISVRLRVVPCAGWRRAMWFDETGLAWTPPSPALPRLENALLYPGTCLIEGTNLSEGRGTATPFEVVGAPWVDGERLSQAMDEVDLPGISFRPARFKPASSKWAGQWCGGVQLQVTDRHRLRPVTVALHLIDVIRRLYPAEFAWRLPHFDQLMGTDQPRQQLEAGAAAGEVIAGWAPDLATFAGQRHGVLLYA
ncbi:MAG: DUF1343 domain-containing protein [Chloroflexi bacterium]|nr:DUF1343 domain-containing protein [Chloroflexota bacterium]MCI0576270.1 DUF1343 domain-containing protein [Chloroflexota bacterium]MCI0644534.1 DUF1343 domain-containing protein [Chloroflexota bacterium]MCI0728777.1 DUF1343 domain-containing protein [Chloroflexota bacterium]